MAVLVPIRTKNPLNGSHRHWRPRAREAKQARGIALAFCRGKFPATLPAIVTLTRLSPGVLDDDNLAAALKNVRDGVADAFGCDDSAKSGLKFEYAQERSKEHGVRVEVRDR